MLTSHTPVPGVAPMSEERLNEIRQREQAATPGPWALHPNYLQVYVPATDHFIGTEDGSDDAEGLFIAHARQDIPDLLAEVARRLDPEAVAIVLRNAYLAINNLHAKLQIERAAARLGITL